MNTTTTAPAASVDTATPTLSEIRERATIDVESAGRILGLGRDSAYKAVREGTIPSLRIGRRLVVPVPRLLALLGEG
ncbi:hypothetical protein ACFC14_17005 [Microbacterium sp. NPDC055988]|uniref:hypothetical protein n=1 Tax=unclassified Microbacterium TaxID=2609290 RepID=UPI0035DAB129